MPYYYHVANVFATASTTETQGLTVIEAMASSLVPICIEDEAFNSMVTNELNGLFFKNIESFKKQVLRLYDDRSELEHFNKQARIQAEHYGSRQYGQQVLDVYLRAIKEKEEENRFGIFSKIIKIIKGK